MTATTPNDVTGSGGSGRAGSSTAEAVVATSSVTPSTGAPTTSKHTVQYMVDEALAQRGDTYRTSDTIDLNDPNPSIFDCSKLTEWSAYQAGVTIPGTSYEQYLYLKEHGLLIPVDQAKHIPGALIFHFSSEPVPGGGRPDEAHVAFSLGDGTDIEAWGDDKGVNVFDMNDRFNYAGLVPGMDYGAAVTLSTSTPAAATAMSTVPDPTGAHPSSGLTIDSVLEGLKIQESGGNYSATNPHETASGAYQYIDSTWAHYGGYAHAKDAPPAVQDAKMRADLEADYAKLHDWERVIAAHFVGEGDATGPKSEWDVHPGPSENQNPSIREYVDSVLEHISDETGQTVSTATTATAATDTAAARATPTTAPTEPTSPSASAAAETAAAGYVADPGRPTSSPGLDSDHDGLTDAFERAIGTDPLDADTDHDGLTDGYEDTVSHTNPLDADTDHDGLTDSYEITIGTDPNDPDSNHNGFTDSYEARYGPVVPDTAHAAGGSHPATDLTH